MVANVIIHDSDLFVVGLLFAAVGVIALVNRKDLALGGSRMVAAMTSKQTPSAFWTISAIFIGGLLVAAGLVVAGYGALVSQRSVTGGAITAQSAGSALPSTIIFFVLGTVAIIWRKRILRSINRNAMRRAGPKMASAASTIYTERFLVSMAIMAYMMGISMLVAVVLRQPT